MGINAKQLRLYIVRPTLKTLELWSPAAENLVMGTAAQESYLGTYLHQLGAGPACGIFQIEPATLGDLIAYVDKRPELRAKVLEASGMATLGAPVDLIGNLFYSAAMCRIYYRRIAAGLPDADDVPGLAAYWKRYYNTPAGKGTPAEFIKNYKLTE